MYVNFCQSFSVEDKLIYFTFAAKQTSNNIVYKVTAKCLMGYFECILDQNAHGDWKVAWAHDVQMMSTFEDQFSYLIKLKCSCDDLHQSFRRSLKAPNGEYIPLAA